MTSLYDAVCQQQSFAIADFLSSDNSEIKKPDDVYAMFQTDFPLLRSLLHKQLGFSDLAEVIEHSMMHAPHTVYAANHFLLREIYGFTQAQTQDILQKQDPQLLDELRQRSNYLEAHYYEDFVRHT